jgi:hypothetical protein
MMLIMKQSLVSITLKASHTSSLKLVAGNGSLISGEKESLPREEVKGTSTLSNQVSMRYLKKEYFVVAT